MNSDRTAPRIVTSKRQIVYRESKWRVSQFKILSGEVLCTVAVLQMNESLLLWIGGGGNGQCVLNEIALGFPQTSSDSNVKTKGMACSLIGSEGSATSMARRLSVLLNRPVFLVYGTEFDRFTIPLVERGLVAEIKSRPECF